MILARPGVEVLVERRTEHSRFAPGFVVFPGGVVDPGDAGLAERWFGTREEAARACALRELREEARLVVTVDGVEAASDAGPGGSEPPPVTRLVEVARWVAPEFLEVRFDAFFYAVGSPGGIEPRPDGVEIEGAWWARPADVLAMSARGEAPLMWPTLLMLEALEGCDTVDDVLALRVPQVEPPVPRNAPGGGPRAFRPAR